MNGQDTSFPKKFYWIFARKEGFLCSGLYHPASSGTVYYSRNNFLNCSSISSSGFLKSSKLCLRKSSLSKYCSVAASYRHDGWEGSWGFPDYLVGFRVASAPEPATLLLLSLGGMVLRKRKR